MRERDLIDRLRAGDEDAFVAVFRSHHASLCRLARTLVASDAVAEEVAQDTWLAVVGGIERFEGRSSLRTWLVRILVNRARTTAMRERRSGIPLDPGAERFDGTGVWSSPPDPWPEEVEDRVAAERVVAVVHTLLDTLPAAHREVVVLRDVEGVSASEVGELLGISDGNQRVRLHRGRARLRAGLAATSGAPSGTRGPRWTGADRRVDLQARRRWSAAEVVAGP